MIDRSGYLGLLLLYCTLVRALKGDVQKKKGRRELKQWIVQEELVIHYKSWTVSELYVQKIHDRHTAYEESFRSLLWSWAVQSGQLQSPPRRFRHEHDVMWTNICMHGYHDISISIARARHCKTRRVVLTRLWSPQLHLRAPLHGDQGMSTQVQPIAILVAIQIGKSNRTAALQTVCIQADRLHCLTTIGPPTDIQMGKQLS